VGLVALDLSAVGLGAGQCSGGVRALAAAVAGRRLGGLQHLALDGNGLGANDGALLGDAVARAYGRHGLAQSNARPGSGGKSGQGSALVNRSGAAIAADAAANGGFATSGSRLSSSGGAPIRVEAAADDNNDNDDEGDADPSFSAEGPAAVRAAASMAKYAAEVATEACAHQEDKVELPDGSVYAGQTRRNGRGDVEFHGLGRKAASRSLPQPLAPANAAIFSCTLQMLLPQWQRLY
jgi:hypothetical protein